MPKPSPSQQRAQRNLRIVLAIVSFLIVLSLILSLLPNPQ
jgi:CHASE3 domain sensor protein